VSWLADSWQEDTSFCNSDTNQRICFCPMSHWNGKLFLSRHQWLNLL